MYPFVSNLDMAEHLKARLFELRLTHLLICFFPWKQIIPPSHSLKCQETLGIPCWVMPSCTFIFPVTVNYDHFQVQKSPNPSPLGLTQTKCLSLQMHFLMNGFIIEKDRGCMWEWIMAGVLKDLHRSAQAVCSRVPHLVSIILTMVSSYQLLEMVDLDSCHFQSGSWSLSGPLRHTPDTNGLSRKRRKETGEELMICQRLWQSGWTRWYRKVTV